MKATQDEKKTAQELTRVFNAQGDRAARRWFIESNLGAFADLDILRGHLLAIGVPMHSALRIAAPITHRA